MNPQICTWAQAARPPIRRSPCGDLRGLPPAVLLVGTLDPLLSDSELFAVALERAGVPVELHVLEDGPHAFAKIFALDMARDAVGRISAFARARRA